MYLQSAEASLMLASLPAVMPACDERTSVWLRDPPFAVGQKHLPVTLVLWSKSDVRFLLWTFLRQKSGVSLSRVAWNCGTPFLRIRLALRGWRRFHSELSILWFVDRVGGIFLCRWFPGSPFPVSCFSILYWGLVSPVTTESQIRWSLGVRNVCKSFIQQSLYKLRAILEVYYFKLPLSVEGACVHHVQQYHITHKGSLKDRMNISYTYQWPFRLINYLPSPLEQRLSQ